MVYAIIAGGVFLSDLILKRYMDKKYARKVRHPAAWGQDCPGKIYNKGSGFEFQVKGQIFCASSTPSFLSLSGFFPIF